MKKSIMWFRRDLRIQDNTALYHAIKDSDEILPIFVFDPIILDKLENKDDRRVYFIYQSLLELNQKLNGSLNIYYGDPTKIIPQIVKDNKINSIFTNRDYEQYAIKRDEQVEKLSNIKLNSFKDIIFYESHEVVKNDFSPYTVFTPYKKKWLEKFDSENTEIINLKINLKIPFIKDKKSIDMEKVLSVIGFNTINDEFTLIAGEDRASKMLKDFEKKIGGYKRDRDFPAIDGTSELSPYFRFGNLSIRQALKVGIKHRNLEGGATWLSELIWREFYFQILANFPRVEKKSFKEQYEQIKWLGGNKELQAWKDGKTGFPIVDAAMRCFKQTGQMHNRLRMIVASFLCKTLLVNWQKGEEYFAQNLMDFELASNSGGWQWASSSGCDAAPYFRIFNPFLQSAKFDPKATFIKKWIPELKDIDPKFIHDPNLLNPFDAMDYPRMIVDYKLNRDRALEMYKTALK